MDVPPQLLQYRYHFGVAVIFSILLTLMLYVAPRLITVVLYFWPLFASTTVFLMLVLVFGGVSPLSIESYGEKAGEGVLDYVAGHPEHYE